MSFMNILIACEFSGIVREAFGAKSTPESPIYAISVDLLPTEIEPYISTNRVLYHYQQDITDLIKSPEFDPEAWDLLIAFPPCTHLAVSGARWFKNKTSQQKEALEFVNTLWTCGIKRICIENPVSILSSYLGKPTQIVHPYMFGHTEIKRTCLWLKNLPRLRPTNVITKGRTKELYHKGEQQERWKYKSRTFPGIAKAMADQWNLEAFDKYDRIQAKRKVRNVN